MARRPLHLAFQVREGVVGWCGTLEGEVVGGTGVEGQHCVGVNIRCAMSTVS